MNVAKVLKETTAKERVAYALSAFIMLAPLMPWQSM
jgi:hypothetical protein